MAFLVLKERNKNLFLLFLGVIFLVIGLWFNNTSIVKADILAIPDVCSDNILQKQNEVTCKTVAVGAPRCFVHAECCALCESDTAVCVISEPLRSEATTGAYDDLEYNNGTGYVSSCTDYLTDYWAYCSRTASGSCPTGYSAASYEGYYCGTYKEKNVDNLYAAMGKWNASQQECITCNGKKKDKICATTSSFFFNSSGDCDRTGDGTFQKACDAAVDASCDDHVKDYACDTGKKCDVNGKCVATATCGTNPQVTADPTSQSASAGDTKTYTITIKNNDQTGCSNRTFKLTASGPSGWPTISLDKASTISLSPGGSDTATLTVKSKNPESDGIYVISVIAEDSADSAKKSSVSVDYVIGALVCPANYKAEFTSSKIANEDNYILNIKVNDNETGEVCVYRYPISGISRDMGISPSTFGIPLLPITGCSGLMGNLTCSNYDTGKNTGGYGLGTYRVTINPDSTSCNYISPCFDTVEVVDCIDNSDCTAPATCVGNTCVAAAACTANGGVCAANGDCCSNNCAASVCAAAPTPGCTPNGCGGGCPANCTGADDPDCAGACLDATCATDTDCVVPPPAASCSGPGMYRSPLMFGYCTIPEIIAAATKWILGLVSAIIILILIFGGITYVTSAGDEERIKTAKNTILYAIVGLAIILLAYTMINEVKDILKIVP